MEECLEKDFTALSGKFEMEHTFWKEAVKEPVGRPKKQIEVVLLTPKVKPKKLP